MGDSDRLCCVCGGVIPDKTSRVEVWVYSHILDGKIFVPQSTDWMGSFCSDCADARKAEDLEELVCSACGSVLEDAGVVWNVQVEESVYQGWGVDIEYLATPKQYCESCAPKADFWEDSYQVIQSILKPELRHLFPPLEKKYDIITVDRCGGCGRAKEYGGGENGYRGDHAEE